MLQRAHIHLRLLMAFLHSTACIISVAMLLLLPAARSHSFNAHFRTPEVRRTTERLTAVALGDQAAPERLIRSNQGPTLFAPIQTSARIPLEHNFVSPAEIPLVRLLNRLKLNPSGSSGSDPLLQA